MREAPTRTVALTGGIAAGKTAVTERFRAHGVPIHDADVAAREVVAAGTPGLAAIVATFGEDIVAADGQLDRRALRRTVFSDADARRQLEAIVHPRVDTWLRERVRSERGTWCLLAIPLLAETWPRFQWVDRIAVVEAPVATRKERLMQRDRIDAETAEGMLTSQASDTDRRALADDVIENNGDATTLDTAVNELRQSYDRRWPAVE